MTIKRNVQLPKSNRAGVKPRADELDYGNLAVNFFAGDEFLSTKNSNKEVVVFPSKNYIEKHPFSSLTIDNLAVNSGASISGNSIIDGGLKVSGDTYLGARTYVKSGNNLVTIENFITETANAGANNYVTDGTAKNNTITLKRKDLPDTTITDVVTTDKIAEEVVAASNGKFVHTTGDIITGTLNFTTDNAIKIKLDNDNIAIIGGGSTALKITADDIDLAGASEGSKGININPQNGDITINKIKFDASSSIQNLTDETSSKSKLNIVAEDEHLYYNGNPIANLGDSLWKAGTGNSAVLLKNSSGSAVGEFSVSEGKNNTASGTCSHAEGYETTANGDFSHAEGVSTTANGDSSHAEGVSTTASGPCSHAEGNSTNANGDSSHAEGNSTTASGNFSHAEGYGTTASGGFSHAEGLGTITTNIAEHASGKYNQSNQNQIYSIGVGTDNEHRRNAIMVMQNGDTSISGGTLNVSGDTHFHGPYNYLSGTTIIENLSATSETFDTALSETSVNAVQNSAITKVITDNEKVTAASLNDLNDRKLDINYSGFTGTTLSGVTSIIQAIQKIANKLDGNK